MRESAVYMFQLGTFNAVGLSRTLIRQNYADETGLTAYI